MAFFIYFCILLRFLIENYIIFTKTVYTLIYSQVLHLRAVLSVKIFSNSITKKKERKMLNSIIIKLILRVLIEIISIKLFQLDFDVLIAYFGEDLDATNLSEQER